MSLDPTTRERLLVGLLRVGGVAMSLAFLAMVMPTAWMDATHRSLGLGPLPEGPVFEYLSRTLSGFYGVHGLLFLLVSRRPRYYREVIAFLALADIFLGVAFFLIDLEAGMPTWWTWGEGPSVLAAGLAMWWLRPRGDS